MPPVKKIALGIRVVLWLILAILIVLMLRRFEHSQVYHPFKKMEATGAELGRPFENIRFSARDGTKLHAWYFPPVTNSTARPFVFLHCHGNGGNISHRLDIADALLSCGAAVLLLDYRGYGESAGKPSEEGTYLDAEAAWTWLTEQGFKPDQIIAYGESLGGGVASELALRRRIGGLVLQSTFSSVPDIGAELFPWLPVRWLCRIKYDTRAKLPRIHVPVLVLHSRADDLIRFEHSRRNFAVANEPKFMAEISGTHNDPLANRNQFFQAIRDFLKYLAEQSAAQPPVNREASPVAVPQ